MPATSQGQAAKTAEVVVVVDGQRLVEADAHGLKGFRSIGGGPGQCDVDGGRKRCRATVGKVCHVGEFGQVAEFGDLAGDPQTLADRDALARRIDKETF